MGRRRAAFFLLAGAVGLLPTVQPAKAHVYTFTVDHCSASALCGTGLGTVTVTQDGANTVKIDVEAVGTGFDFVNSAGKGNEFFFNIGAVLGGNVDNPTISVTPLTPGWALASTTAGSYGGAGWNFEYALTCLSVSVCAHGASNPKGPPLIFDVTATGLTPASFYNSSGSPVEFAADVRGNLSGNTGLVGATRTSVPEASGIASLIVMLAGVGAGVLLKHKRLV